jgi:hypothetical protein
MGICWGIFGFVQLFSARYLKRFWRANMWIHSISGLLVLFGILTMGLITFKNDKWELKDGLHPALGLTMMCIVGVLVIGGLIARWQLQRSTWSTARSLLGKMGHSFFGYIVLLVSQVTLITGGIAYADRGIDLAFTLVMVEVSLFVALTILSEVVL